MVKKSICVVGAGPAGLVATKSLLEAGLDVTCYEMSEFIGGNWVIDNPNGRSAAYQSLTTNTSKRMSRLSDYSMPDDWPEFPSHIQVRSWFESYIDHFDFRHCLHTCHEVISARPIESDTWEVCVSHEGDTSIHNFDALIAASGNYWDPNTPEFPGVFNGEILHAQKYRSPQNPVATSDKNVVVVGIGNTGCEFALELSRSDTKQVYLSARSGSHIFPKYIDGPKGRRSLAEGAKLAHPLDKVPPPFSMLPQSARVWIFEILAKYLVRMKYASIDKRLQKAGLPPAPVSLLSKRPTVADNLPGALEAGDIVAQKQITLLDGDYVVFEDGVRVAADMILCATGYRINFPYLDQSLLDTSAADINLFRGFMHPSRHNFFVVGICRPTGGFWPIAEAQSMFIAQLLSGKYALPSQRKIEKATGPILNCLAFNPAFYGLALREELERGKKRLA